MYIYFALFSFLVMRISFTDLKFHRIGNVEVLILLVLNLLFVRHLDWLSFHLVSVALLVIALFFESAIGMGDVKLIIALLPIALSEGDFMSWQLWSWSLGGVAVLLARLAGRPLGKELPFAPFLFMGLFLAIWAN